jgi:hypothetical protein
MRLIFELILVHGGHTAIVPDLSERSYFEKKRGAFYSSIYVYLL